MKVLLTTLNAKYIHKNLALRWLYVAAKERKDVFLKEFVIKDQPERIVNQILDYNCEVVAFSVYIWNIEQTKEVIRLLKEKNKNIHVIVGGPEVSYDSYELINEGVDAISLGEGEISFWNYIEMLESNDTYEVKGIYTNAYPNTEYQKMDLRYNESLENPYFLEMDEKDMGKRYFYFETSRGCPYGCTYCLSSADRMVRMFSEEYVLNILEKVANSNIRQVKFLDRTFNANPQRALRIARYINEHCLNQIFQFEVVAETLSDELLDFFTKEADPNRFRFEIGVQSFNCETLKAVGRLQNNERLREVIARMKSANLTMHVDLIAGLPYEDKQSFQKSFDTLFALEASEVQLGVLKLLKGTKLRKEVDLYEFKYDEKAPYTIQSTSWLSTDELKAIENCASAVEKYWNSGKCQTLLKTYLTKGWYQSPFQMFMDLGVELSKLKRPYALHDLFDTCRLIVSNQDSKLVDAIVLTNYYALSKQKPKRFTPYYVSQDEKKELLMLAVEKEIEKKETLFHYGNIDLAYKDGIIGYQLIVYNSNQTLPKRWFINKEKKEFEEL